MWQLIKMIFRMTPGWVKEVARNGKPASATVLSDPKTIFQGVAGYQGKDGWIEVQTEVHPAEETSFPADEASFPANITCRLSQALGGLLEPGVEVHVRYDPGNKKRVLLMDDVDALLRARIIP